MPRQFLFAWTGDGDRQDSDFLAVIDVDPASPTYAQVVRSVPVGERATNPHHTEHRYSPGHPLFVSSYAGNRIFRFDLRQPLDPRLLGSVAIPSLHFSHSFERLPNGNVLATMQTTDAEGNGPGGLVELRDDGSLVRLSSAAVSGGPDHHPYSLLILPNEDRIITSSTRMVMPLWHPKLKHFDHEMRGSHLQLWRLSDLRLLKTIQLPDPQNGGVNVNPFEPPACRRNCHDLVGSRRTVPGSRV
jgi:hypothetical protein